MKLDRFLSFSAIKAGQLLAAFLLGCCLSGQVLAASAQDQLRAFVKQVHTATGIFQQTVVGPQGETRRPQTGKFSFERPGNFNWEVLTPYAQLIVSDGRDVFQLDPDLNQVTVRKVDQAIGASPAAILFGTGELEQVFVVTAMPDRDGLSWLRAKPRSGEAGFVHLELGMRDNLPARVVLLDAFGQTTRVELSQMQRNPDLPASLFKFVPPVGADVVRMQ